MGRGGCLSCLSAGELRSGEKGAGGFGARSHHQLTAKKFHTGIQKRERKNDAACLQPAFGVV